MGIHGLASYCILFSSVVLAIFGYAHADESVPIGVILSNSTSYNLQMVTVNGIVGDVKKYPPHSGVSGAPDIPIYGSYVFVLADETGSIEVEVLGAVQSGQVIPVIEGERVKVIAQIQSSSQNGLQNVVRAIARVIQPVPNNEIGESSP